MGHPSAEPVLPSIARELCERVGAKVAVSGSIVGVGEKYIMDLHAMNCLTGSEIAHEESEAPSRDRVLTNLGAMIPRFRLKLGESVSSIQKFDTPIEQATTKSLPALKAFAIGDEARNGQHDGAPESFYKMAIDLDPDFAMAYARLGVMYGNVGNGSLADEYLAKAFERREHVSEREKLYIASHYYADSTRELDKAIEILRLWTQTYPNDWVAFNSLSSFATKAGFLVRPSKPASKPCG